MNREILFRGFHWCDGPETIVINGIRLNGEWVFGDLFQDQERVYIQWLDLLSGLLLQTLRIF